LSGSVLKQLPRFIRPRAIDPVKSKSDVGKSDPFADLAPPSGITIVHRR
jgi:hypothetical protein